ncbi:hypothetical protein ACHAWO_004937 [Cyclotella atomus]|uniref:Uncharacterized protein n=1 Tax=Cyclotella atomus TaxID=382360 RepID=A0ABD3NV15_9STRA
MPVADELAALRALGTVKTTSATISSKAPSQTFTTPQQQELLRKQKVKQEKKAREQAAENLRKHNAGGINDLWYKKLRELKARKRAGYVAWKKQNGTGEVEGEEDGQEEDMGLEVGMLPEHLVKALKAKYETENAEEALSKALKEEEEGRGSILSEVMADLEEENDKEESEEADVAEEVDDEKKPDEAVDETAEVASTDNVQDIDESEEKIEDSKDSLELQSEQPTASDETNTETEPMAEEGEPKPADEEPTEEAPADDKPTEEEPVEQVRSKIEKLSIEDAQSFEEKKESDGASYDAKESEAAETTAELESTGISEQPAEATIDETHQTNLRLFYNVHTNQFFTDTQNTSEDVIDLSGADQRAKLENEQNAQLKEQLVVLQDQIKDLLAGW